MKDQRRMLVEILARLEAGGAGSGSGSGAGVAAEIEIPLTSVVAVTQFEGELNNPAYFDAAVSKSVTFCVDLVSKQLTQPCLAVTSTNASSLDRYGWNP